ncbi:TetR/AcrR family transcriptional regulator [Candidatus Epulonipiscium viviparus]|uniref:TetR/AcrR family transcriptional regulator n=1 Tax=Candidatus Epulonipiscium viviparus TaxID=420336 RepID=UPI0027380414|nr:TetR/AcrR family transcriptional regulator [Candidatus Epulopiscium viviparus]
MNNTKAKILSVFYELIAEQGYEKTSTSQICALVGVKKPTLYYYFNTKEELLIEFSKNILIETIVPPPECIPAGISKSEYEEYLYTLGLNYINFLIQDKKSRQVLAEIKILEKRIPALKETIANIFDTIYVAWIEFITMGKQLDAIDSRLDSNILGILIGTIFEGIDNQILYYFEEVTADEIIQSWRQFVDLILKK